MSLHSELTGNIRYSTITKGFFRKTAYLVLMVERHVTGFMPTHGGGRVDTIHVDKLVWTKAVVEDLTKLNVGAIK